MLLQISSLHIYSHGNPELFCFEHTSLQVKNSIIESSQIRMLFHSWTSVHRHSHIQNSPKFEKAPKFVRLRTFFCQVALNELGLPPERDQRAKLNHTGRFYIFCVRKLTFQLHLPTSKNEIITNPSALLWEKIRDYLYPEL